MGDILLFLVVLQHKNKFELKLLERFIIKNGLKPVSIDIDYHFVMVILI